MAPSVSNIQKVSNAKGGRYTGDTGHVRFPDDHNYHDLLTTMAEETITHETMVPETTTMQQVITTIQETITTLMPSQEGGGQMRNNTMPDEGGADENTNFDMNMPNGSSRGDGSGGFISTSTGTSLELITTTLSEGMHMEHTDEDEYNYVLFIILGVVLGILIITTIVLGVVYSHYRKKGFQEISGDHGTVDPQSMKQLQQASSQDALLDK